MSRPPHPEKIRPTKINLTECLAEAIQELASITGSTKSEVCRRILTQALAPTSEVITAEISAEDSDSSEQEMALEQL